MGMYDYIRLDDARVVCAHGHRIMELQTKDMDCDLDVYHVAHDGSVTMGRPHDVTSPCDIHGWIYAIGMCPICPPRPPFSPTYEFKLKFTDGKLLDVLPMKQEVY